MAQPSGGKPGPDFLVEAALAHASAAKVWEALAERERLAVAANQKPGACLAEFGLGGLGVGGQVGSQAGRGDCFALGAAGAQESPAAARSVGRAA